MNTERAFEILGVPVGSSVAEIKKAFRHLAMTTHPDKAGGEQAHQDAMAQLNVAYEVALTYQFEAEDPKCVCRGFTRNPLCKAHEEPVPKSDEQCTECGGTKRVPVGSWTKVMMDCPKCS